MSGVGRVLIVVGDTVGEGCGGSAVGGSVVGGSVVGGSSVRGSSVRGSGASSLFLWRLQMDRISSPKSFSFFLPMPLTFNSSNEVCGQSIAMCSIVWLVKMR